MHSISKHPPKKLYPAFDTRRAFYFSAQAGLLVYLIENERIIKQIKHREKVVKRKIIAYHQNVFLCLKLVDSVPNK